MSCCWSPCPPGIAEGPATNACRAPGCSASMHDLCAYRNTNVEQLLCCREHLPSMVGGSQQPPSAPSNVAQYYTGSAGAFSGTHGGGYSNPCAYNAPTTIAPTGFNSYAFQGAGGFLGGGGTYYCSGGGPEPANSQTGNVDAYVPALRPSWRW